MAAPAAPSIESLLAAGSAALAAATETPRLDAELLLEHAAGIARSTMLAFPERNVAADDAADFEALIARRARGEPLAYITGVKEFYSLELEVGPGVLVPRPETELLVEAVLERAARGARVLDLGTGSGAIAIAVKRERPDLDVTAVDASAAALAVARRNAARLRADVRFLLGDWCAPLGAERFSVVARNPPYVATGDAARGGLAFEPRLALDGGADGLDAIRALLASAAPRLTSGGVLLIEHGHDQRAAVETLAAGVGLTVIDVRADLAGHARVLVAAA